MKKILITQSNLTIGGIQKSLINTLNQLDFSKYDVDLFLYEKKGEFIKKVPKEVKIYSIREEYNLRIPVLLAKAIELLGGKFYFQKLYNNTIIKKKYDIAIAYDGYVSYSDYFAAFSNAKKKIIWVHSDYVQRKKHQLKFKMKMCQMKKKYQFFDEIVAVSKSAKKSFDKLMPNHSHKSHYIWNFIEEINDNSKSTSLYFDKYTFNIVSIGSLLPVKGYERLILTQKKLKENGFRTKFYIIGEGKQRKRLEKLIKKHQLEDSFILLGKKENVFPILKGADVYISSSYYEGLPTSLIESLIMGTPIIVPKVSGCYDVANEIAPKGMAYITENSINGLYTGIVNFVKNDRCKKSAINFNIKSYNQEILKKWNDIILNISVK